MWQNLIFIYGLKTKILRLKLLSRSFFSPIKQRAASRAPEGASEFCFRDYFLWKFKRASRASKGPPCKEHGMSFSIRSTSIWGTWFDNFGSKMWLEQINFIFSVSWFFQALTFVKRWILIVFTKGACEKMRKFAFSSFWSCKAFKTPQFRQRMFFNRFSLCGELTN